MNQDKKIQFVKVVLSRSQITSDFVKILRFKISQKRPKILDQSCKSSLVIVEMRQKKPEQQSPYWVSQEKVPTFENSQHLE